MICRGAVPDCRRLLAFLKVHQLLNLARRGHTLTIALPGQIVKSLFGLCESIKVTQKTMTYIEESANPFCGRACWTSQNELNDCAFNNNYAYASIKEGISLNVMPKSKTEWYCINEIKVVLDDKTFITQTDDEWRQGIHTIQVPLRSFGNLTYKEVISN